MFILFPHQLYNKLPDESEIYLVEDPILFGFRPNMKLQLNKLRLVYQRYLENVFLEEHSHVHFVPLEKYKQFIARIKNSEIKLYDPVDHAILNTWKSYSKTVKVLDTPSFLLGNDKVAEYIKLKNGKRLRHAPFYTWMKKELQILERVESQDKYNRLPYPKEAPDPPSVFPEYKRSASDRKALADAVSWVNSHFRKNPGEISEEYLAKLPCTHREAIQWLDTFLAERFSNFGKYEDAIVKGQPWMFHSGLSIPLNYGLLTPQDILEKVKTYRKNVAISSYEGFIRQIIGWREYCRIYYYYVPPKIYLSNHFKFKKTKLTKSWYSGTTGIPIVDDAIKDGWTYGYLHHIRRLMVMANFMTLSHIHPDNIYKWMYEFSLDSNDVFMVFNCYSMGSYADGGYATFKPYISSSNYIKTQSREPKGEWETIWDDKYKRFKAGAL